MSRALLLLLLRLFLFLLHVLALGHVLTSLRQPPRAPGMLRASAKRSGDPDNSKARARPRGEPTTRGGLMAGSAGHHPATFGASRAGAAVRVSRRGDPGEGVPRVLSRDSAAGVPRA